MSDEQARLANGSRLPTFLIGQRDGLTPRLLVRVSFGGPTWIVGGTVFEMWLGSL